MEIWVPSSRLLASILFFPPLFDCIVSERRHVLFCWPLLSGKVSLTLFYSNVVSKVYLRCAVVVMNFFLYLPTQNSATSTCNVACFALVSLLLSRLIP